MNVHNCVHSQYLYTGTTTATVPVLSHMMYHSDSLYHTVIAAIFIVTPTVSLSYHTQPVKHQYFTAVYVIHTDVQHHAADHMKISKYSVAANSTHWEDTVNL